MAGWLKLNCAIQTDSVKIQNAKIDIHPDATTGCIKHYLLAEIIKSGHQFVMRNFDDLRIVLVREADVYESDKRDGTLMICSWSASSECDYDRITQTAEFRRSRKASGGDWEVSLLICTKSHAEVQEEAQKEQEAQERSKKSKKEAKGQVMPCGFDLSKHMWTQRPCDTKGHVDPEDKRVREIENRIPARLLLLMPFVSSAMGPASTHMVGMQTLGERCSPPSRRTSIN